MTDAKDCPFCGAKAAASCAHLALAARATDFVGRCVESCKGEWLWQLLINNEYNDAYDRPWLHRFRKDDFRWLESSFSSQFMEQLVWFGRMEYEWREGGRASGGEMWVLLWSKDPQRFWWQLRDELERQTDDFIREAKLVKESEVLCPVCGCNNSEVGCAHLAFHGDDLRLEDVVECVETVDWEELTTQAPECAPECASDFFDKFGDQFPSLIEARSVVWEGGAPGLSGVYEYVWAKNRIKLLNEIGRFLNRKIGKLRRQKTAAVPSQKRKLKVPACRANRKSKGRGSG